jgi:hypothetical protein
VLAGREGKALPLGRRGAGANWLRRGLKMPVVVPIKDQTAETAGGAMSQSDVPRMYERFAGGMLRPARRRARDAAARVRPSGLRSRIAAKAGSILAILPCTIRTAPSCAE